MRKVAVWAFGWLIPGGAYLLDRRYTRFAMALVLVSASLTAGIALQGSNRWPAQAELQGVDCFTVAIARVGALTKILAGGPYMIARLSGYSQSFVSGQVHEYGTMLLIAAGLINLLALSDAGLTQAK